LCWEFKVSEGGGVWVGIDIGTQTAKVLAVTSDGQVLGQGRAPLTDHRDGPRHEQDANEWWAAVGSASRAALAQVAPGEVRRVAVCATSGTLVVLDRELNPLGPALMYDDQRAARQSDDLIHAVPAEEWRELGMRPQPSSPMAKLAWLRENWPHSSAMVRHQADFVTSRLAGEALPTDTSHALKSGADPITGSWPPPVRAALGLPDGALPEVVRPGTTVGTVCTAAAEATGIAAGTPIVAGMTDGCAAQLASGVLTVGGWNSVLGTTLVFKGVARHRISTASVYSHLGPDGMWWPGGASNTGAGALSSVFTDTELSTMDNCVTLDHPAGAVLYPLVGRGERFPFVAGDAVGFALGQPHDRMDHYAALLQGVAYVEKLCVDQLAVLGAPVGESIRVTGGGVRSAAWTQLRADVLDRRLEIPAVTESAFGMAVLAAGSVDGLAEAACRMVRVERVFHPRPWVGQRLAEGYRRLVAEMRDRGWLPEVDQ
jgi:sugar (pentulose or hexulose) kinase